MEIKCEFERYKWGTGIMYTCMVSSAVINNPDTKVKTFNGNHLPEKTDEHVQGIQFNRGDLKYFPKGIEQLFPNLKALSIFGCGLKKLTKQDLVGLQGLTTLWLPDNELISLSPDLLEDMTSLKFISFRGNKLKFIDSRMFEPLKSRIKCLYLNKNQNIDAFYHPYVKNSLNTIEDLLECIDDKCKKPANVEHHCDREKAHLVFEELWGSRCYADFTIIVEKKEIKVHKAVLGTQSSVFAAMFETDMEENKSAQVEIKDFTFNSVEEFIRFFYTGGIPEATNAMEIFALAIKYDVEDLKLKTEEIISSNINNKNAIEVLELGNLFSSEILMTVAFEEVKLANPEFNFSDQLKHKPDNIRKLIEGKRKRDLDIESIRKQFDELEKLLN